MMKMKLNQHVLKAMNEHKRELQKAKKNEILENSKTNDSQEQLSIKTEEVSLDSKDYDELEEKKNHLKSQSQL